MVLSPASLPLELDIESLGLVSALGTGAAQACAAARAGIVRAVDLPARTMIAKGDGEPEAVRGHAAHPTTLGFQGFGRHVALAREALRDLEYGSFVPKERFGRAALYLATGAFDRYRAGWDGLEDEAAQAAMEGRLAEQAELPGPAKLADMIVDAAPWALTAKPPVLVASEHTGFAEALRLAAADLAEGVVERAVVGAVDSLLDDVSLDWLMGTGRLKSANQPVGIMPGEGAVFLILKRASSSGSAGTESIGQLRGLTLDHEPSSRFSGEPPRGEGLVRVLEGLCSALSRPESLRWLIVDQNGEVFRGAEWGEAVVRLIQEHPELDEAAVWPIIAEFGDAGVATGALALARALRAFAGGYAPGEVAVITSCGDGGGRAALAVSAASESSTGRASAALTR